MKWQLVPVEPTDEMLDAVSWPGIANFTYSAMLEAAPQPPALTDERIFKLFLEKAVDKGTAGIYDFARAIEREILGRLGMTEAIDALAIEKGGQP